MKKIIEKIIDSVPYYILLVFVSFFIVFIYQNHLSYERLIDIVKILIWPMIVLLALLFFRKVFVYLFLSMEEFNFFGIKGGLKDVRKLIEEKVQERIQQEKAQEKTNSQIVEFSKAIENAEKLKEDEKKRADNLDAVARNIFSQYKELSEKNVEMLEELNEFRRQKTEREARIASIKEKIKRRRDEEMHGIEEHTIEIPKANKSIN